MNAQPDTPTTTPGTYLRLRREAAGRPLAEAARIYARGELGALAAEMLLDEAERDLVQLGEPQLRRLHAAFALDAYIYLQLADPTDGPAPAICLGCGCSWHDACLDEGKRGCAWANDERTLCTACERKAAGAVAA